MIGTQPCQSAPGHGRSTSFRAAFPLWTDGSLLPLWRSGSLLPGFDIPSGRKPGIPVNPGALGPHSKAAAGKPQQAAVSPREAGLHEKSLSPQSIASHPWGTTFLWGRLLFLMNLPSVIPVMLLQQCNTFPHGLLPLYIFEPRYRAMVQHALKTDRMFCIGTLTPSSDGEALESDDRISEFSTAAVIRACVGNQDGTSHLVLQGMQRVRFVSWEQYQPFRIARIEPIATCCRNQTKAARKSQLLLARVLGLICQKTATGQQLATQLQNLADPAHVADFVAGNLVRDASARQPLLGMTEVEDRLDFLLKLMPDPGEKLS